jgi:hypothetical protein
VDMGGVKKEWFLLVIRKIFTPVYGKSWCIQWWTFNVFLTFN